MSVALNEFYVFIVKFDPIDIVTEVSLPYARSNKLELFYRMQL